MLYIIFYLNLQLKYVVKYLFLFFLNTSGYLWISVDIKKLCGYLHNGYRYMYGTNIYPVGKI